jgi:hypothetical protein
MEAECEDERRILLNESGFEIMRISKKDKEKNREWANIFAHVSEKFFATMSKAQGSFCLFLSAFHF